MSRTPRPLVLVADDDPHSIRALEYHLQSWGYRVRSAAAKRDLLESLSSEVPALLLLDLRFGEHDGTELLQELLKVTPELVVVILTAHGSIETAVTAIKFGAYDYLTKPADLNRLKVLIDHAIEKGRLKAKIATLEQMVRGEARAKLVGSSPAAREVDELISAVAPTDASVLILGESGTGKELAARVLHERSARAGGPFVPLNMAALPRELVESTLFGHEKGSFTGAEQAQVGCCEAADKGTLFLDEIGEMDINLQAKLLRFLQEHTFQRVGSSHQRRVDVRILAATNRDPLEQIRAGQLREDLYYRLNVVPVVLPPLRDRPSDVPELADLFLTRSAARNRKDIVGFTPDAMQMLTAYHWPGNVRQLENLVERMVILCRGERIDLPLIPHEVRTRPPAPPAPVAQPAAAAEAPPAEPQFSLPDDAAGLTRIEQIERSAIIEALRKTNSNVREAAKLLGLGQATVYRKLKKYRIG